MHRTGRNDPCPCGSGKKYKRCCLGAVGTERTGACATFDESDLEDVSGAVVHSLRAGKLVEAEAAARDLLARFPDVHDGHDRLAMVYEARGDRKRAAFHYRQIVELVHQQPDVYDPEFADGFQKLADRLDPPAYS